jgi:hypothetical protein
MRVNGPVKNNNTGKVHWGTVDTATNDVTRVSCGKPLNGQYTAAKGEMLTCAVCKTKLAGTAIGYKYKSPKRFL